jgi:serine/threonine-protein kinase
MRDDTDHPTLPESVPSLNPAEPPAGMPGRYADRGRLGVGAMGEVRLCDDGRIGREVALKMVRAEVELSPPMRVRFLREAKIQARLDHPSIVPVYDIDVDDQGLPFFTMKRVRGVTLRYVLDKLSGGDPESTTKWTRRKLLTALATICLTLDYAHERGVVHRDLKPSNVMLGDYGEIYVLDWGVARQNGVPDSLAEGVGRGSADDLTAAGVIVGTPGYMAPEQLMGEPIDARADVYSLGALLFEILALEPLHARGSERTKTAGRDPVDARPSVRAPNRDVPPELDALCVRATAFDPKDRFAAARELHAAIDRYLEGDRDLERRKISAEEHAKAALDLLGRARAATRDEDESEQRTRAMGEVSRALAFNPDNDDALRALFELLTTPPRGMPEEAQSALATYRNASVRPAARAASFLYMAFFPLAVAAVFVLKVRGSWYFALSGGLFLAASAALFRASRFSTTDMRTSYAPVVLTSLALSSLSAINGPLILVPSLVLANAVGFLVQPDTRRRALVIGMSVFAVVAPQMLEWAHLVPPSYVVSNGRTVVMNRLLDFTETTHLFLVLITVGLLVAIGVMFTRFRDAVSDSERRFFLYTWQLQKLLPRSAPDASQGVEKPRYSVP